MLNFQNENPPEEKPVEEGTYNLIRFEVTNYGRYIIYFPAQPPYEKWSLAETKKLIAQYWESKRN